MGFKKMQKSQYPPRLWALVGYPGSGKSTFAAQMQGPVLVVDADHRFDEVLDVAAGDVYQLSDSPADNVDTDRITATLAQNMPGSNIRTIVVDSLTAIIAPLVVQAMVDKDLGKVKNLAGAFRTKALAMRQLQDAVTRWGTAVLWIYHLDDARDQNGQKQRRASISKTELARLTRSINLQLEVIQHGEKRGIKVVWARSGRSGMKLWDDTGTWAGMPEAIEEAVYGGLSEAERAALASRSPEVFPNPETAIAWGVDQGAFEALPHARNAYDKLKREEQPTSAREMAALWVADVQNRLQAMDGEGEGEAPAGEGGQGPEAPTPEPAPVEPEAESPESPEPESEPEAEPEPAHRTKGRNRLFKAENPTQAEAVEEPEPEPEPEPSALDEWFPRDDQPEPQPQTGGNGTGGNGAKAAPPTQQTEPGLTPEEIIEAENTRSKTTLLGKLNFQQLQEMVTWLDDNPDHLAQYLEVSKGVRVLIQLPPHDRDWPAALVGDLVATGLAGDAKEAVGALQYANVSPDDPEDIVVRWFEFYRSAYAEYASVRASAVWANRQIDQHIRGSVPESGQAAQATGTQNTLPF